MAKSSPLHRVIDAGRWEAEPLFGRFVVFVHAAFLDAGFVPHPHGAAAKAPRSGRRAARLLGATASTLSLRYTAPHLVHRPDDTEDAVLGASSHGPHAVFYLRTGVLVDGAVQPGAFDWQYLDALAAAPLMSGGLDDTARALTGDGPLSALWRKLAGGTCRRLFVDVCRGVPLKPSFMSLSGDLKAAILGRLSSGKDLAMAESTCTELRLLVAERDGELWRPVYQELVRRRGLSALGRRSGDDRPEMSWKDRYMWAAGQPEAWRWMHPYWFWFRRDRVLQRDAPIVPDPADTVTRADARPDKGAAGRHGRPLPLGGNDKRRHGAGATHSPSSRYRWKHR